MGESFGKVIAIFLAAILMFIFPVMVVSQQQDKVAAAQVQAAVVSFVDEATAKEMIKQSDYDNFVAEIYATGNSFKIEIEHQILDVNNALGKKGVDVTKIGANSYYSTYFSSIMDVLKANNGVYHLSPGDILHVTVTNSNTTIGGMFLKLVQSGESSFKIVGEYTKMVH